MEPKFKPGKALSNKLRIVEYKILSICQSHDVSPNELENYLECFSFSEKDILLHLFRQKLAFQKAILKEQTGLNNLFFLEDFR